MQYMQSWTTAALFTFVLDIVVNEKGVMEYFDRDGGVNGGLEGCAEDPRGCDAEARTHHLASALGIVAKEVVEIAARLAGRERILTRGARHRAILLEHLGYEGGGERRRHSSSNQSRSVIEVDGQRPPQFTATTVDDLAGIRVGRLPGRDANEDSDV